MSWDLRNLIQSEELKAARKYRKTWQCWNPQRAAFYSQVAKRYGRLHRISNTVSSTQEVDELFRVYAAYKTCLFGAYTSVSGERNCYEKYLRAYVKKRDDVSAVVEDDYYDNYYD